MKLRNFKKEQQKNEKEIVSVDGVFFDNSQQFINLKKKQPFIEIHFKVFINFVDHFKVPIGIVIITFASMAFLGSVFVSKANVATFYPDSCLGGWDNPANASGKPDLADTASGEDFSKDNSALIKGTSEIYCGGFTGEIPQDTSPKRFILSLSWSIDDGSIIHHDPEPFPTDSIDTPATTPEVIETPEDNSNQVPSTEPQTDTPKTEAENEVIPAPETQTPPDVPPTDSIPPEIPSMPEVPPADTSAPQSFLDRIIAKAYAQESDTSEIPADINISESVGDIKESETKIDTKIEENPQPEAPIVVDINTDSVIPTIEEPSDSFMDVVYTVDGTIWTSLGKIGRNNWQNISFDIPLTSWEDLSQFQVALKPIQTIDTYPVIYLDGMLLSVEYESEIKIAVNEAVPIYEITNIENTGTKIVLSNEGTILAPDQILITSEGSALGNIAVFNKTTGVILLTTTVEGKTYPLDLGYFGEGEYTVINTGDPDSCSSRTLEVCLSSSDFVGSATFSVKNKNAPPETISEQSTNNSASAMDNSTGSSPSTILNEPNVENIPSTVLDLLNIDDHASVSEESKDTESGGIVLPPVDTSSGQEVTF